MVGTLPVCCARAASGHAAAPPTSVTKSRRRMLSTRCASLAILTIKTRKGIRRNGGTVRQGALQKSQDADDRNGVKSGVLSESRMSAFAGSGHAVGKAMCEKCHNRKS